MIEGLHGLGSRVRRSPMLAGQHWLWDTIEPSWQAVFGYVGDRRGFATPINGDVFKLTYAYGARYSRTDQRAYEPDFYGAFVTQVAAGMTVLDVGAHIGMFTLGAAMRVGPMGCVVAFEPSPDTARVLRRHVRLNGWTDRVAVVEAVVSDRNGTASFYTYGPSMAASLARANVETLNPEARKTPAVVVDRRSLSLDAYCADQGIYPSLLKIDVEGAELAVLRGARKIMTDGHVTVLCEIHPLQMENCDATRHELEDFVSDLGYTITPLDRPNSQGIFHALIRPRAGKEERA